MNSNQNQGDWNDTAGDWFVRLHLDDCWPEDYLAFAEWVAADEENWNAYKRCQDAFHMAEHLCEEPGLCFATDAAKSGKTRLLGIPPGRAGKPAGAILAAAAAAIVVAIVSFANMDGTKYETKISEQRLLSLSDGSKVQLNTDTSLTEEYSEGVRRIVLHQGEALFEVAKSPEGEPFVVQAGTRTVTALGTVFNVFQKRDQVTVTVLEGKVAVEPVKSGVAETDTELIIVNGGEELSYDETRVVAKAEARDINRIQAWRRGNLEFDAKPLLFVVEEMNRYSKKKIVIGDPTINNISVSGKFRIGSSIHFVDALNRVFPIQVLDRDDHFLLLPG